MSNTDPSDIDVVAAGAVLWRPDASGDTEVALVHRPRYDDWSFPKGKLDPGETVPMAAAREINEETGYAVTLGAGLGESRYQVPQGNKIVHYWAGRAGAGEFVANGEVDELRWVSPTTAGELLSYQRDLELLARFRRLAPPPAPLLLVRHAKAGRRADWAGHDDLRPLTAKGQAQAAELVALLRLFGPTRLYAAPLVRCTQTIQPLADHLGLSITPEPLLSEESYRRDPSAAVSRLLELTSGSGPAVVCSQGGVIPNIVNALTNHQNPPSRKGSTWALGFTDGRLTTADYYPEPTP